ncbi:MAG: hypothetical protein H6660_18745, partial [Ardenticatenaceae bacterium]|nr:hypothetical protein [Ardenticatenaceae bacterium]
ALAPGQAAIVLAQIAVPAGTMSGTVGQVGVTAVSQANAAIQAEVLDEIIVTQVRELAVSAGYTQIAQTGSTITYTHLITNLGNYTDTFAVIVNGSPGWKISYPPTVTIAGGSSMPIAFVLQIPANTCEQKHTMTITIAIPDLPGMQAVAVNVTTINASCVYLPAVLNP